MMWRALFISPTRVQNGILYRDEHYPSVPTSRRIAQLSDSLAAAGRRLIAAESAAAAAATAAKAEAQRADGSARRTRVAEVGRCRL
jgi:hypothetical protein